jgi:hypothetical protein
MSDNTHLLILGAAPPRLEGAAPLPAPPNLARLLQAMALESTLECPEDSPSMPWEVALARLQGLPAEPGLIPWAASETATTGTPCAWLRPSFWQVGADHVMPADPDNLQLEEADSRALLAAMAPYFAEDGIELQYRTPTRWLATGETFRGLSTISLDRVVGRRITPSVFDGSTAAGAKLRRLQNEMQMLLYTNTVNEERQARDLLPVNSFWITGAGVLDALPPAPAGVAVESRLHRSTIDMDPAAHAKAWAAIDGSTIVQLLAQVQSGNDARLTLCGERFARTYRTATPSLMGRLSRLFGLNAQGAGLDTL